MPVLGDFETEDEHARWLGDKNPRTLRRLRNQPDGLPYTTAGQMILYKREWTLAWLESRRTVKNPARPLARGRRARPAERSLEVGRPP